MTDDNEVRRVRDIGICMRNLDNEIDAGTEDALRADPGVAECGYAGWNFFARVHFDGERFIAVVRVYGSQRETLSALSLPQLMNVVSAAYGAA